MTDQPEEYNFWLGLQALALAVGDRAVLLDEPVVKANLFVCLYGPSGIGKTKAVKTLTGLLREALPYNHTDPECAGAYVTPQPGSAEALVDLFAREIHDDPSDPKKVTGYGAVRGLVRFDELATLMGKANRAGSVMKPTLIELFDSYEPIELKTRGSGLTRAERHFCCATTTTQPGAVRELLVQTDADSGFVNRWVFAVGPLKELVAYGATPVDIGALVDPLRAVRAWASSGRDLRLVGDALEVYRAFFKRDIAPLRMSDSATLLARVDLILKKLIVLFCANEMITVPSKELVERAISLFPYLCASYNLLVGQIGVGQFELCRQRVQDIVSGFEAREGRPMPRREFNRALGKRFSKKLVLDVIRTMVALGELDERPSTAAVGCPGVTYSYTG